MYFVYLYSTLFVYFVCHVVYFVYSSRFCNFSRVDLPVCPFNTCLLALRVLTAEAQKFELHERIFELSDQLIRLVERVLLLRNDVALNLGPLPCKYFKCFLLTLLRFDQSVNSRRFFVRLVELVAELHKPGYLSYNSTFIIHAHVL